LKRFKSPAIDQILGKVLQTGGNTLRYDIHKLINSIWNKEKLPQQWKESIIVPIYKKSEKTDHSNYGGTLLLPTTYKMLSNIFISSLTPYVEEIIGDHQCGFRYKRSTNDQIFHTSQTLEKSGTTTGQYISYL